jgi:hypothetical protein
VLLGLPLNLLGQLGLGHHRHGDLANDDALSRNRERALFLSDFGVVKDPGQCLGDGACVHDLAVDDHRWRERGVAEAQKADAFLRVSDLANLD